ncbi:MAG TPA: hypothetical protein VNV13_06405, partial [Steroidobacteraceae bacterium]|nr:hypothetical protein [Steroidobacteraceae bacterium]
MTIGYSAATAASGVSHSWQAMAAKVQFACAAVLFACHSLAAAPAAPAAPQLPAITENSFRCVTQMTHVRHYYVDNLAGNLAGTVHAAESTTGEPYPVGSVLQLVPTEVMVKREKGYNAATHDWEFFELDISADGTKIRTRGFAEVVNRFGGNCFACHIKAQPQWDLICDNSHGCDPIPLTRAMTGALARTDPRCKNSG